MRSFIPMRTGTLTAHSRIRSPACVIHEPQEPQFVTASDIPVVVAEPPWLSLTTRWPKVNTAVSRIHQIHERRAETHQCGERRASILGMTEVFSKT